MDLTHRGLIAADTGPFAGARREELLRQTVRSLARDAAQVVVGMRFGDEVVTESAKERLDLLHHYLDYMIRLCDGQV